MTAARLRPVSRELASGAEQAAGGGRSRARGGCSGSAGAEKEPPEMFVYTSNVDTAFERVGFPAHRVLEIHGNVCAWQVRACLLMRACVHACMKQLRTRKRTHAQHAPRTARPP